MSRRLGMGGKKNVLCTFLGAPGETFTIKQNGSVIREGVAEDEEVELKQGVYEVIGSISEHRQTVTVKKAGEYSAYPDGAIYWYGREIYPVTARLSEATTYAAATKNTNDIYISATHANNAGRTCVGQVITNETIDTSSYSTIKVIASRTQASGANKFVYAGYTTSNVTTNQMTGAEVTATTKTEHSTASPGTAVYLGVSYYANTGGSTDRTTTSGYVYAIWME